MSAAAATEARTEANPGRDPSSLRAAINHFCHECIVDREGRTAAEAEKMGRLAAVEEWIRFLQERRAILIAGGRP